MKRLIAPLALALAVVAAPAEAHSKKAKTYRGTFQFVGADGGYVTGHFGKAHLVDGKRNDKLSVHVRRLAPKTKYSFRLQQGPRACEEGAPGGTDVTGFKYRRGGVMKTNRKGVANSSARSRTFRARRGVEYFVGVYDVTSGEIVLCAELRTKGKKSHKPHVKHKPAGKDKGKAQHKPAGNRGRGEDKGRGGDKARGRGEDKPRGKGGDTRGRG